MPLSMTGFASGQGAHEGWTWVWDLRAVNGRGLDLRLRLPDWIDGLEAALRPKIQGVARRGTITLGLRVARAEAGDQARLNTAVLAETLDHIALIEAAAMAHGVNIIAPSATDILNQRGILESGARDDGATEALKQAILADIGEGLNGFSAMRAREGAALETVIRARLDEIAGLVSRAEGELDARTAQTREALQAALARVLDTVDAADPQRVAQELAMIAVKTDVTEELDRLRAHVSAARALLDQDGPVGRKLDFLTQEFMREANTLCAKAQGGGLTGIGLDLKTAIDQMREQVQNLE